MRARTCRFGFLDKRTGRVTRGLNCQHRRLLGIIQNRTTYVEERILHYKRVGRPMGKVLRGKDDRFRDTTFLLLYGFL